MCIPGANAQVDDKALTRSGEVGAYDGTRTDFLTVAGKLSRYPKLSKAGESLKYAPIVTTDSVPEAYITSESARVYGNIVFNGWLENVTAQGFEVSTDINFENNVTTYTVTPESAYIECDQPCVANVFSLDINPLQGSTTYFVRAYATNAVGTSYGEVLTFTTPMAVAVAGLPYFTDFSEDDDKDNWFLNNGNFTNYWMMGTDPLTQNPALFVTTNGETPGYNETKPVTVMAERYLLMDASDSLTINLDLRMYGESGWDYLKVFLAPKSTVFIAQDTNITPYSGYDFSQYALRFPSGDYSYVTNDNGSQYLHLSCLIDNPLSAGDTAKLVFLWCNDRSVLHEPPAIISSVEVIPLKIKTDSVVDITYNAASVYSTMTTTLTENLERGLCYSKYPGVTVGGQNCTSVVLDQLNGSYPYILTNLVPNTTYYVCAYALSENGVVTYGDELSFQTEQKTLVATLPYKTNFNDGYDWLVDHTISTTQNYWNFGLLDDYTDSAMYVTFNDGTQAQYYLNATTNISAERLLRMPQTDSVHVTFYVKCGGEGGYDWMKVLLVPVNEEITTAHYANDYSPNAMDFSNYLSQTGNESYPYKLNLTQGNTLRIAANLKNPMTQDGDTAKLVFLWHTDGGGGVQPGPIITDLYVSVLDVDVYTDSVSDITDKSANVYGHIHNPKNEVISKVGVCYSKHINPTFEDNIVESTTINADNTFLLPISNLDYNTTYYVRTFMKVDNEVFFGDQTQFMSGMAVIPDELPYVTDFSDRQQWWMNNGDCQNYWKTGKLTDDGDSMLFITNDALYLDTCGYDIAKSTFVTAEKYLKMPDNQHPIELTFDVNVGGESSYDYLMVYLCPKDQEFIPNSTGTVDPVTTNAFDFRHYKNVASGSTDLLRYYLNLTNNNVVHINDLVNNPVPGDTAKLVFLWRTDGSGGTQPGPVISNLSVVEYTIDNVLPYSTDFSSDNEEWILYSGASKNYFMAGVSAGTTQSALFVTHDGETCSYLADGTDVASLTYAETYFSFPENDSLLLEFDAKAGGEGCCDFLMAFVSNWDVEYTYNNVANATSDNMGAVPFIGYSSEMSSSNTYRIQLTNGNDLHHFSVKVKNPAPNGLGKLVFAWRNDGSGGVAPFDVMVTNVSLTIPAATFRCGTSMLEFPNGHEYETVEIGGLCWTKSNLREIVGTDHSSDNATSSSAPYCYVRPNVDESIYGYYYNWEAAKIACPEGWHLPSDAEWNVMESGLTSQGLYARDYRGDHAGKLAYGTEWNSSDNFACPGNQAYADRNVSGFSARAASRFYYTFNNGQPGNDAYFWTSSKAPSITYGPTDYPVFRSLNSSRIGVQRKTEMASIGMSVRCIRDMEVVASDCPSFEGNAAQNGWVFSAPVTVPSNVTVVGQYYRAFSVQSNLLVEVEAEYVNGEIVATVDLSAYPNKSFQVTPVVIASGCEAQLSVVEGSSATVNVAAAQCPEFGTVRLSVDTFIVAFTNPANLEIQFGQFRIPTDDQNESVLSGVVDVANGVMYHKLTSQEMEQYIGQTINVYPFMKLTSSNCGTYNITGLENEISFTLVSTDCPAKVQDASGHEYAVLQIGSQCWMAENLRTTSYSSNLTGAPTLSLDSENDSPYYSNTEAYCYYPGYFSSSYVDQYGLLYNWYAVMAGQTNGTAAQQVQGICPEGWHVPSEAEFETLLQSPYFPYFKQYPTCAGYVDFNIINDYNYSSYVGDVGDNGYFWSSDLNNNQPTVVHIYCDNQNTSIVFDQSDAASVRCVKNAEQEELPCPTLGSSVGASENVARFAINDYSASKVNPSNCGYVIFAPSQSEQGVYDWYAEIRKSDYNDLVNITNDGILECIVDYSMLQDFAGQQVMIEPVLGRVECTPSVIHSSEAWEMITIIDASASCIITSFPFIEGFENDGEMPDCWSQQIISGDSSWRFQAGAYSSSGIQSAYNGNYNAYLFSPSNNNYYVTRLISPVFDLSNVEEPYLSFWHTQKKWSNDQDELIVYYRTSSTADWQQLAEYTDNINVWTLESFLLPDPSSTYQIAFEGKTHYGYGITLDDITVGDSASSAVSCPASVTDYRDYANYLVMQVGNNCWMAENLRYIDEDLPVVTGQYSTSLPYLYVPNAANTANSILNEGYLYNWMAAINSASSTSEGMQGLCPAGWHLPTEAEASELVEKLGSDNDFSDQFLTTSGYYLSSSSNPQGFGSCDWYWITYSEGDHNACIPWCLDNSSTNAIAKNANKAMALSVRCVKDAEQEETDCAPINSFPYFEGFEHGGNMPDCWSEEYVNNTQDWEFQSGDHEEVISAAYRGSYNAFFYSPSRGTTTKLISPVFDFSDVEHPYVSFWHAQAKWGNDQDTLTVYYRVSETAEWQPLVQYTSSFTTWTFDSLLLPNPSSSYQIAFEGSASYGYGITLDNITVDTAVIRPSLGSSTTTTVISNGKQILNLPIENYDAEKIRENLSGYAVFGGNPSRNFLIVYKYKQGYSDLVHINQTGTNTGELLLTIDFALIADSAESRGVQLNTGDEIRVMPILSLVNCGTDYAYGDNVTFTMPSMSCLNMVDSRNNQTYQTMMVGDVCWMKENLRYRTSSSELINGSSSISYSETSPYVYYPNGDYRNLSAYGYLYNWAAATNSTVTLNVVKQGICPDGWRLPTKEEAQALLTQLNSDNDFKTTFLDHHAGYVYPNHGYLRFDEFDWFWITALDATTGNHNASLDLSGSNSSLIVTNTGRNIGRSIRCVKGNVPSLSVTPCSPDRFTYGHDVQTGSAYMNNGYNNGSSRANDGLETVNSNGEVTSVTDYDGNVYRVMQIGHQCWLAENMRCTHSPITGTYIVNNTTNQFETYTGKLAKWYNNDSANAVSKGYGLLYNWNSAVDIYSGAELGVNASSSSAFLADLSGNHRGICPKGWHIPTNMEWETLADTVSYYSEYVCGGEIGKALASAEGWSLFTSTSNACAPGNQSVNPNNATGFSGIPVGYFEGYNGFTANSSKTHFWSTTEGGSMSAYNARLQYDNSKLYRATDTKIYGFSVRCIRN